MDEKRLTERIAAEAARIGIPAWSIVVRKDHKEVYRHLSGCRDYESTLPLTDDTAFWLYSLTKIATNTAAVQLIERGKLHFDDLVGDILPAFQHVQVKDGDTLRPPKRPQTVLDLMTMRGGFDYDGSMLEGQTDATNEEIIDQIAKKPLLFDPGEKFLYSLCHDVLAGVIAKVSGMSFRDWLQTQVFEPLGMTATRFIANASEREPFCAQYIYENGKPVNNGMENHFVYSKTYCSGGAGLTTTLNDYILLLDALANGGVGANGVRILKEESVALMGVNRLTEEQTAQFNSWRPGYGYGLGMRVRLQDDSNPKGFIEFGWDGAAGAYGLCDTTNHLAILYLQNVRNCGPAYDELHPKLRDWMYEELGL